MRIKNISNPAVILLPALISPLLSRDLTGNNLRSAVGYLSAVAPVPSVRLDDRRSVLCIGFYQDLLIAYLYLFSFLSFPLPPCPRLSPFPPVSCSS